MPMIRRRGLLAMGAAVDLFVESDSDAHSGEVLERAVRELRRLERILSPHRPDSQLSALNRGGGLRVGRELWEVIDVALAGREATGARYDPVVRVGRAPVAGPAEPGVARDARTGEVRLAGGVTLDAGEVVQAWCLDAVADVLRAAGPCFAGDGSAAAFSGLPEKGPWIELPLDRGGIATARLRRPGPAGGRVADALAEVTIVAQTAAWAEMRARSLLASGMSAATREALALGFDCVLTPAGGPARPFGAFAAAGI